MDTRTTAAKVKSILLDDFDSVDEPSLTAFIETACVMVNRVETCAITRGKSLTVAELELVERWLAAHCYAMSDQPLSSKSTEGASGNFQGQTGMYLEATKYGQMAMKIDWSGCLEAIAKPERKVAGGVWLGRPPSAQTPYNQRD